jgi:flagellar motor switch protein FliM
MSAATVYRMIDLIFGGKPGERIKRQRRDFTRIELRTITAMTAEMLKAIQAAWQETAPVSFAWQRVEARPQFVGVLPAQENCVVMHWEVDLGSGDGDEIALCIPSAALDPIYQLREEIQPEEGEELRRLFRRRLQRNLMQLPVTFTVELGQVPMSVGQVRALRVGTVIPLGKRPTDPVVGLLEGIPRFLGMSGTYQGSRAVKIIKVLKKELAHG